LPVDSRRLAVLSHTLENDDAPPEKGGCAAWGGRQGRCASGAHRLSPNSGDSALMVATCRLAAAIWPALSSSSGDLCRTARAASGSSPSNWWRGRGALGILALPSEDPVAASALTSAAATPRAVWRRVDLPCRADRPTGLASPRSVPAKPDTVFAAAYAVRQDARAAGSTSSVICKPICGCALRTRCCVISTQARRHRGSALNRRAAVM